MILNAYRDNYCLSTSFCQSTNILLLMNKDLKGVRKGV